MHPESPSFVNRVLALGLTLLLAAGLSDAHAICSSSIGQATLNEIYEGRGGGQGRFMEVRLLQDVPSSVWSSWTARICVGGGPNCTDLSLSGATLSNSYYLVFAQGLSRTFFNLNNMDVALLDASGDVIDYLSTGNYDTQLAGLACSGFLYDTTTGNVGNSFNAHREPDGTGNWSFQSGNSYGDSEGESNDGSTPVVGPSSFVVAVGAGAASTCQPREISITALDSLGNVVTGYTGQISISTSSNNGDWSNLDQGGSPSSDPPINTIANGTSDDGAAAYTFDALDSGGVAVFLSNTHADDLSITVTDSATGASGTSGVLSFRDNAFVITPATCTGASCPGVGSSELVAGRDHQFDIALWRRDASTGDCAIATAYTSPPDRGLKLWLTRDVADPGGLAPSVGAAVLPNAAPGSDNLTLSFLNGEASLWLSTADVGRYTLELRDDTSGFAVDASGAPRPIDGGSPTLTVRPFALGLTNITRAAVVNPGGVATDTGNAFAAAGQDYSVTVGAYLWAAADDADGDGLADTGADVTDNGLTPGYAWATGLSPATDAGSYTPTAGIVGTLSSASLGVDPSLPAGGFAGGSRTVGDLAYDEVGSLRIDLLAQGFLGAAGVDVTGRSPVIGRFYPDHLFLLSSTLTPSCGVFTYMGQPELGIDFAVEARVAGGALADNYFLDPADPTAGYANVANALVLVAENADDGADRSTRLSVASTLDWSGPVYGQGLFQDPMAVFSRGAVPDGPFTTLTVGIELTDPDGVGLIAPDLDPDATGDCVLAASCSANALGVTDLRYGRLELRNTNGTELQALTMPAFASVFDGTSFVVNSDDSCTSLGVGDIAMNNPAETNQRDGTIAIGAGSTTLSVANSPAVNGVLDFQLSAPGAGNTGYAELTPDLGFATGAGLPWLEFDWDANPAAADTGPTARATFGVFSGNRRQIYTRELF